MKSQYIDIIVPQITPIPPHKININTKIFPICDHVLHFDGCSKGNPGPSGIGAVLYNNYKELWVRSQYIGDTKTNNESEYCALILGLEEAIERGIQTLSVYGDSLLVINQLNSVYRVKNYKLIPLYNKVLALKSKFIYIEFNHVYREQNKRADELANLAIKTIEPKIYDDLDLDLEEDLDQEIIVTKAKSKAPLIFPLINVKQKIQNTKY